ncbi:MAG: hypothetical protein NZ960_00325 [Candidatus Kapabacteria bacterium]|nr:hypothetical protein [Candidatus Kapabacteria bacterium]MDW8011473.1 hypothetical protein [Bacteroidota bacterium]
MASERDLQHLHELLEGDLPVEHEEKLFWRLATEEDLRIAFRQLLLLHRLLPHTSPPLPPEVEDAIVERLGFRRRTPTRLQPWIVGTISALLGAGVTALVLLQFFKAPAVQVRTLPSPAPIEIVLHAPVPASTRAEASSPRGKGRTTPSAETASELSTGSEPISVLLQTSSLRRALPVLPQRTFDELPYQPLPSQPSPLAPVLQRSESAVGLASPWVSIRTIGIWEASSPDIMLPSRAPFGIRNVAAGVFTTVTPEHSVGLEVGSETFPQEFTTREGALYRQRPTLLWGGLSYEWSPEVSPTPFMRMTLGGTVVGPLAKMWLGLKVPLGASTQAAIGLEGTALFYRLDNRWFVTRKIGLSYGMALGR